MVSTRVASVIRAVTAAPVVQPASVREVAKVPEVLNVAPAVRARSRPRPVPPVVPVLVIGTPSSAGRLMVAVRRSNALCS